MMRALWAGVSGLKNHQTRMDVIGNNIANVNTVGFKASRVTFQDMLSQTMQGAGGPAGNVGGTNPMQVGMGMAIASVDTVFTDGAPQATGKQTDLAISGQGFFQVSKDGGVTKEYTRNGAFDFDSVGNYVVPNTGYKVMGYAIDDKGIATGNLEPIVVSKTDLMPGKVSTSLSFINNLSDSAKAIENITVKLDNLVDYTTPPTPAPTAGTLVLDATNADDTAIAINAATPAPSPLLTQATLDATGAAKQAALDAKTATKAALDATLTTPPATATVQAGLNLTAVNAIKKAVEAARLAVVAVAADPASTTQLTTDAAAAKATASAALALVDISSDVPTSFDVYASSGTPYKLKGTFEKITANQWAFTPTEQITDSTGAVIGNVSTGMDTSTPPKPIITPIIINFSASGAFSGSTASTLTITPVTPPAPAAGPAPFQVTPDFKAMTQYDSKSTAMANATDGYSAGSLDKLTISPSGMFTGVYTNGVSKNLAQVALFTFNNPGGLTKSGGNLYAESNNSGVATKDQSSSINPGNLEMSNVDLAQQFSDMIVTQRGFQANSKIITTTDTMLEELVNLKR